MKMILIGVMLLSLPMAAPGQFFGADNMNRMDHGPFVSSTIAADPRASRGILAFKGVAVKVNSNPDAVMVFDTDLLRVAGAWTGGFLRWYPARDGLEEWPSPGGPFHFMNQHRPGWAAEGEFKDPRPLGYGPLPETWGRYKGLHVHGQKVVFSYTVGDADVLELFGFERGEGHPIFTRTFQAGPGERSLSLHVLDMPEEKTTLEGELSGVTSGYLQVRAGNERRVIGFRSLPRGATWRVSDRQVILDLPRREAALRFQLALGPVSTDSGANAGYMSEYLQRAPALPDLAALTQPGPRFWKAVETKAAKGDDEGPFAVDLFTLPMPNPWNSHLRMSALDFLSDGRAVVSSLSGDVWLVDGIGESPGTLRWTRFATGLNQPLGVRVVKDRIHVTGRDQITILHDGNGDGRADFYENFNNRVMAATNFHAFTLNLETDSKGNFYFGKATPWPPVVKGVHAEITPHHGVLFKVSPDGKDFDIIATGLRNPNGLSIGPGDEIVYSDNEGNWAPTSYVQRIRPGGFHGFVYSAHLGRTPREEEFKRPIVWIPHFIDNSPSQPIFITEKSWPAELHGHLLLLSYGRGTAALVLLEEVDGEWQGAHLVLPLQFKSGLQHGRFHRDGHLYIAGLTSWQSVGHGGDWGSFHRVRYTGRPLNLPVAVNTRAGGLELRFSDALDRESAINPKNYDLEQWTYPWTSLYGTRGRVYSVNNPGTAKSDPVEVISAKLSADGKTVYLEIPGLKPGPIQARVPKLADLPDQMEMSLGLVMAIEYNLKTARGAELNHLLHKTIHRVPSLPFAAPAP
jgi:hypothetical protein